MNMSDWEYVNFQLLWGVKDKTEHLNGILNSRKMPFHIPYIYIICIFVYSTYIIHTKQNEYTASTETTEERNFKFSRE